MKKTITILISLGIGVAWGQPTLPQQVTILAPAPASPTCSAGITGAPGTTTLFYWPVANYPSGQAIASVPITVTNAPGTLNGSNFVNINCNLPPFATTMDLLKSTTSSISTQGTASVAVATASTSGAFTDQGGALSSYTFNNV